jgi:hypothetical protein
MIVGEFERFNVSIALMSNKLCHCADKSLSLVGVGTQSSLFKLEYITDEEYTVPPMANTSPILVPPLLATQTATPSNSNMETIPLPSIPRAALQLIVNTKQEGDGHLKVSEGWLAEMREICKADAESPTLLPCPVGCQHATWSKRHQFDLTFGMCCPLGDQHQHLARLRVAGERN